MDTTASYLKPGSTALIEEKAASLEKILASCTLCPRECRANRLEGRTGYCKAPATPVISSIFPHYGEESPLVGTGGSGTIFLTHCNLRCVFCQNCDISIQGSGTNVSNEELATAMMRLQHQGCHNINFVTPTHYVPALLRALLLAIDKGLSVPLVYNCSGYESVNVLKLLDGIIDIYMPDIKFLDSDLSERYCAAADYPDAAREALKEMQRQVGDLVVDERGIARRGVLIRHLVMPSHTDNTRRVLRFIRDDISRNAYVNIMAQYHPCHEAFRFPEIARRPSTDEYSAALAYAREIGLERAGRH